MDIPSTTIAAFPRAPAVTADDARRHAATPRAGESQPVDGRRIDARPGAGDTPARRAEAAANEAAVFGESERRQVQALAARDREVRAHEHAHLAAAGSVARGGASYSQVRGPDGRYYATGGEVAIDTSPVPGDPQATVAKAQRIRRAALAPVEPSSQDRQVASQATAMEQAARAQLLSEQAMIAAETREAGTERGGDSGGAHGADCPHCGGGHTGGDHADSNRRRIDAAISPFEAAAPAFTATA